MPALPSGARLVRPDNRLSAVETFTLRGDKQARLPSLITRRPVFCLKRNPADPVYKDFFHFNSCAAGLFDSIFHSFKAGIADAISSFK